METTLQKRSRFALSDKTKETICDGISYLFIALFLYTAVSKLMTFESFERVLGRSPLIGHYNTLIAWTIPIIEIVISGLLLIPLTKKHGMYLSFFLMLLFTVYLIYMILSGSQLPCHCGGVISSMSWKQHIVFNTGFIALAVTGLIFYRNK
ncbi:MauE/DoxX family redox-associated membrane protein [Pedobacter nutrimenti]|uniref:Methylamine utilization protein MauE n=1 Tax=Pedobacter nutrimenti TaxID=1241337 RepID=A0A318UMA4_9SPHI|nr:MauE/DoxX family redox-associated membrane protein [Pedobacter nutrimenti]PYF76547.1 methylamine utilization protein MauE [Pedobacter nutrimenti]